MVKEYPLRKAVRSKGVEDRITPALKGGGGVRKMPDFRVTYFMGGSCSSRVQLSHSLTISFMICTPTTSVIVMNIKISGFIVFQDCRKPISLCHFGVIFKIKLYYCRDHGTISFFHRSEKLTLNTLFPVKIPTLRNGTTTNPINSREPSFPMQKHSTLIGTLSDFILVDERKKKYFI